MASGSFVGFSSRNARGPGGYGVSGRRRLTNRRTSTVTRVASSSSYPAWAADQHQELLAARDQEALTKLAGGGIDDFITYANGRISALGGYGPEVDQWKSLLADAQSKQAVQKTESLVTQYQAQLKSGEMAGDKYLAYLNGQLGQFAPDSAEYTALITHIADAKTWIDMNARALEKRHDEEMAAGIANGEIKLEDALSYYQDRRSQVQPGDPAYATLTTQIANLKDGIIARDFNAKVQAAHSQLVDAGNTTDAKKAYLGTLTELMNTVKDPKLQNDLYTQIQTLQTSIQKDGILKDAQETNAKMVDYFDPNGKTNATTMLQFLAEKALSAKDPAEAAKYTTLAEQVQSHERQKAADAVASAGRASGGAAGAGFTTAATNRALNPFDAAYKDALDTVNTKLDRGLTPTQADWAILKSARDNYQTVIGQAFEQGNLDAKGAMQDLARTVKDAAGSGDGWDFGKVGDKQGTKLVDDVKTSSDEITRVGTKGDTELYMQAIGKQNGDIAKALASPFVATDPAKQTALKEIQQTAQGKVADVIRGASDVILGNKPGSIAKISAAFDEYQNAGGKLQFDPWMAAMTNATNADRATQAVKLQVTPSQLTAFQKLSAADQQEQSDALDQLVTATAARRSDGTIDPAWLPNGQLDESTRAAKLAALQSGNFSALSPLGGGKPTDMSGAAAAPIDITSAAASFGHGTQLGFGGRPQPSLAGDQAAAPPQLDMSMLDAGTGAPTGTDVTQPTLARPVNDVAPADVAPPSTGTENAPQPDPWAAAGMLDESTRAAARAGFTTIDPLQSAWTYLNAPVDWQWPGAELPQLPPEGAWTDFSNTNSFDAGFDSSSFDTGSSSDYGMPSFDLSQMGFGDSGAGPGAGAAQGGTEAGGGPTLTA